MAQWLKRGATAEAKKDADRKVRDIVEAALADIEARGDAAVREMSNKFDGWDREDYRLTRAEIDRCVESLTPQERKDIEFAQTQVRNFAQIQHDSMLDVEVETMPGVVLECGALELRVNGQVKQKSDLSKLIWNIPELIADLSQYYHLQPGDLIYTGTPEGVGPLQPGDRVEGSVEGVGAIALNVGPAE